MTTQDVHETAEREEKPARVLYIERCETFCHREVRMNHETAMILAQEPADKVYTRETRPRSSEP
jgi:hypothetical protein